MYEYRYWLKMSYILLYLQTIIQALFKYNIKE